MADAAEWKRTDVEMPAQGETCPFSIDGRPLLLCNVAGTPYVVADRCPHASAPLSKGRLTDHVLECPLHGGKLDVRDGTPIAHPIRKPVAAYPIRRTDDAIEVSLEPFKQGRETDNA